jgi:type II secretory pathway predicted ATPase ExeA
MGASDIGPKTDLIEYGNRLNAFRLRHELSCREMAAICGGDSVIARSSLQNIFQAIATRKYVRRMQPIIEKNLRSFLAEKGSKRGAIEVELEGLSGSNVVPLHIENQDSSYEGLCRWGERLNALRNSLHMSYRQLWCACGGESVMAPGTMQRICEGGKIVREERVKSDIIPHLRAYLEKLGKIPAEVNELIRRIFNGEDNAMIAPRTTLPTEAQRFFGLRRDPFTGDPRSKNEVFITPQLDKIAGQVEDAINYQGFLVVTGEIGSGKSMLKRRVIDTAENSGGKMKLFWPEFFNMDRVHSGSIVSYLLHSFDQSVPGDLVARAAKLKRILADASADGERVALGFDECHHLHDRLLTALKNFWELGTGGYTRFIGLVLFGQSQFEGRLREARFREICERIEVVRMPSFEKPAWDYIAHRIKYAGGDADKLFEREAVKRLSKQAKTPLALGNLANAALLKAYEMGERKVLAAFIKNDFEDEEPRVRTIRRAN